MKKSLLAGLGAIVLGGTLLSGCASAGSASLNNLLSDSIYCTIDFDDDYDFTALKTGQKIGFTITPDEDYYIGTATLNGTAIDSDGAGEGENSAHYTVKLTAGANRLSCSFDVDPTIDFVEKFKLNVSDATFYNIMNRTNLMDFRADGIEQMRTEYVFGDDAFINYVDGDTTHMETYHYGYTVKIRYLSIDTPESTSELEEWGKSASIYNETCLSSATYVILQSQGRALYPDAEQSADFDTSLWSSDMDSYGRNLGYVWYTTSTSPTLDDFRCLNLEMVYQGFSYGNGSISDSGLEYYKMFEKAQLSAQANGRGMFSGEKDANYCYDDPVETTLEEIYAGTAPGGTDSTFNDEFTLYSVKGYVSRKIEGAFYFQNKADYEQVGTEPVEDAYGMYVFTYTQTTIQVGDYVCVTGIISEYGGNLQMMGISWSSINPDYTRDTYIISSDHEIVPIKVTKEYYESSEYNYNHVLVEFVDSVYAQDVKTTTLVSGVYNDYGEGGTHAINKYNEVYPYYNTSNKLIFRASLGEDDSTITRTSGMRITVDEAIICSYGNEYGYTYKYFTGGTNYYLAGNPDAVAYMAGIYDYSTGANSFEDFYDDYLEYQDQITVETYTRKQFHLIGISQYYTSTSGATESWTINIVKAGDVTIEATYAAE